MHDHELDTGLDKPTVKEIVLVSQGNLEIVWMLYEMKFTEMQKWRILMKNWLPKKKYI